MKKTLLTIFLTGFTSIVFPQVYVFDSIPDNLKKRADAVVRSEQCLYEIIRPGNAVKKIRKAITLLNEDADGYRFLNVGYDNYSKINYIRGTIYDEKGSIIKVLGMTDVYDMSAISGGTFYSDDRIKFMYFPIYKYPYTIEYEYEVTYSSLLNYPSWNFQDSPDVSVQKSGIQFIVPENMKLRYYEEYMNSKVDSIALDGKKIFTWQEENMPAYQAQDYSIRQVYHSPSIHTAPLDFEFGGFSGSMRSWEDFGKWFYEINKGRDVLPQEEINAVKAIASKAGDTREKVRLIYEYMQSRTRYVSIQIAIGGYRSAEASAVSRNGFGDCKALVNYTYSLLKSVGIYSFYALVRAGSLHDINKDFVDNQFNHVILCVPMPVDTIWLECTSQSNPFNYLSSFTADKDVLVLTPEGGKIVRTPGFTKNQSQEKRTGSLYLNILGSSSGKIFNHYSGYNFGNASGRYSLQSEEEIKRYLYSRLRYTDFDISSVAYSENKSDSPTAQLAYQLDIKNFATTNGPRMYFNPSTSVQGYLQEIPVHLRIPVPDITSDSISYNLPLNYRVEYMPENVNIENKYGKFTFHLSVTGEKLIFRRTLELNKCDITAEEYTEFRTFVNAIAKTDREKIILIRTDV
ncbi:MAG: DUF3857 domain-containing protein [Bacteroidota bacterium]